MTQTAEYDSSDNTNEEARTHKSSTDISAFVTNRRKYNVKVFMITFGLAPQYIFVLLVEYSQTHTHLAGLIKNASILSEIGLSPKRLYSRIICRSQSDSVA